MRQTSSMPAMDGLLSFCFLALSSSLAALWFLRGGKNNPKKKKLPPGPWRLPVIGSLHHIVSALPHRRLRELSRRHGPLMLLKLGEVPTLVVSSAEAAELVLKTNDPMFASRPWSVTLDIVASGGKGIIFAPYGEPWRQMRKLCIVELLSSKQVKRMHGIRAEEVGSLLRSITAVASVASAGATVNVTEKVAALSNNLVTRAVLGGKFVRQDEYLREVEQIVALLGFCLVDMFPSSRLVRWLSSGERNIRRSFGRVQRIIADVVEVRKAARACSTDDEDLLDVLLRLQEEDSLAFPITTEIIGAVLFDLFGAATETTTTALEWAMAELVSHPEVMAKAQLEVRRVLGKDRSVITNNDLVELDYMRMVIKEVLRLHPPSSLLPRRTIEDCEIMGYHILKDTNVYVNIFAISRDEKYWKNPEDFNPERFEKINKDYNGTYFEFAPFGSGRRQCPGIQFSSSVMEVVLANFLYHFDWMLPDDCSLASFDMSEKFGLTVSKRYELKLRAIPHVSLEGMPSK